MSSLSSTTTAHNLDSSDANGSCSSTKSGTLNKQQCCDAFITWRLGSLFFFFFPSPAFAMHCDNGPDADYWVHKVQGAWGSTSTMTSTRGGGPEQHSFDLLRLLRGLGDFTAADGFLLHTFDHSHCHSLTHVADRKPPWGEKKKVVFAWSYGSKLSVKWGLMFSLEWNNKPCLHGG